MYSGQRFAISRCFTIINGFEKNLEEAEIKVSQDKDTNPFVDEAYKYP